MQKVIRSKLYFITLFLILGIATIFLSNNEAKAAPIAYVGYENSTFQSDTSCCRWLYDPWNSNVFRIPVQGNSNYRQVWVSSTIANEGQRSFGVWLKHNPNVQEKQRGEFEISQGGYYTQHLGVTRYYGIALYIHPQSPDVIGRPVIFMQAWQAHETDYPKYPPFSLRFIQNSDYKWSVTTSNDVAGVDSRYTNGTENIIFTSTSGLAKGVWHEFIVAFKPSVQSDGLVKVWHNGNLQVSQTNQRNFGYQPRSTYPEILSSFEIRFGAYRTSVPENVGDDIILMFDQAKYGTSYESVDP